MNNTKILALITIIFGLTINNYAIARYYKMPGCENLPGHSELTAALKASILPTGGPSNGGLDFNMWATVINTDGFVCNITFSGDTRIDQWPGSRDISAQKANTARSFSLPGLALSTANLYKPTQPGGSLFGLQFSNPVDPAVAYGGPSRRDRRSETRKYGTRNDPMIGRLIGGVNVFGGGLALYNENGIIGAVGVSGDTSCADHNIAWRVREILGLGTTAASYPGGVDGNGNDGIIYDQTNGFSHPTCGNNEVGIATGIGAGTL